MRATLGRWRRGMSGRRTPGRWLLVLAVLAMVACSWLGPFERVADAQVDAGLKRALVSFASARALNAAISFAQGTEIAVQPAGVGINLTVGQVLDPLNDLVEQFADLMLMASVAFGVQKVLLAVGAHAAVSALLTLVAAAWAYCLLRPVRVPLWLARLLVVLLLARFAVPAATLGGDVVFRGFLAADYQASQQAIAATAGEMERATPAAAGEGETVLERFRAWAGGQAGEWKSRFERLKSAIESATDHFVRLMVIFLLQTLIVPLLLLWLLARAGQVLLADLVRPSGRVPD